MEPKFSIYLSQALEVPTVFKELQYCAHNLFRGTAHCLTQLFRSTCPRWNARLKFTMNTVVLKCYGECFLLSLISKSTSNFSFDVHQAHMNIHCNPSNSCICLIAQSIILHMLPCAIAITFTVGMICTCTYLLSLRDFNSGSLYSYGTQASVLKLNFNLNL